jgi:hypothetical protein
LAAPSPSVYRTRSHVARRRVLIGAAGVALLLVGYGLGRWQDSPAPAVALPPPATSAAPVATTPVAAPTTEAPKPTVYKPMQAEAADGLTGVQTQDTEDEGGGQNVGWIANGDSLRFDNVDFGAVPATKLEVRVASEASPGGRMDIHLDSPDQPAIGTLRVTSTGGWQTWRTDLVDLSPVTGVHAVFCTFARDNGDEFVNINWLLFGH